MSVQVMSARGVCHVDPSNAALTVMLIVTPHASSP
jgi:hypothetical protein